MNGPASAPLWMTPARSCVHVYWPAADNLFSFIDQVLPVCGARAVTPDVNPGAIVTHRWVNTSATSLARGLTHIPLRRPRAREGRHSPSPAGHSWRGRQDGVTARAVPTAAMMDRRTAWRPRRENGVAPYFTRLHGSERAGLADMLQWLYSGDEAVATVTPWSRPVYDLTRRRAAEPTWFWC